MILGIALFLYSSNSNEEKSRLTAKDQNNLANILDQNRETASNSDLNGFDNLSEEAKNINAPDKNQEAASKKINDILLNF